MAVKAKKNDSKPEDHVTTEEPKMAEVVKKEQTATPVTQLDRNYFESYGSSMTTSNIVGTLLKFNKGDWLTGKDDTEVPAGTKMVVEMDTLEIGWLKWVDGKPAEQIMGKVLEGFSPPRRSALGDTDESEWEVDAQGKARDPWQFSNYVLMRPVGLKRREDEDMFTFATSSRGGLNAIGALSREYGKEIKQRPDVYPIVELRVDAYNHPDKSFGRIKIPVLKVVGWEAKEVPA